MRAGACTVHQALTPEAASIVKQAVGLARRRGHAQVTPLHVASTMLTSPTGLLRAACLQSHSHPLQCKALELCFNVALNRLPATSSSGSHMLGHHHHAHHPAPVLSNALVAAFKRAQAHQRRGLVETQQQPLLTVKIELQQLIISILDDPSVSRVMREAGFSSTQVKANVEQAISSDNLNPDKPKEGSSALLPPTQASKTKATDLEDVMSVVDILAGRKRRSVVVVAESLSTSEAAVKGFMDMITKGEVPDNLTSVQFINIQLHAYANMSVDEVQQKIGELRCHVRRCCIERGAVLYLGDLKWVAEYWSSYREKRRCSYCPIESVLREIGKFVYGGFGGEIGRGELWILGTATYQVYMSCRVGSPSLEILLGLHPLTVPAGSLDLSLNYSSYLHCPMIRGNRSSQDGHCWTFLGDGAKFQSEAQSSCAVTGSSHAVPSWLQLHKEEKRRENSNNQNSVTCKDHYSFWNFMGSSGNNNKHQRLERTLSFSSVSPSSSSHYERNRFNLFQTYHNWPISAPTSRVCSPEHDEQRSPPRDCSILKPVTNLNTTSSADTMEMEYIPRFKELSAENLKALCNVLEEVVPWHKETIPDIASAILQCRSGLLKRKERSSSPRRKEDTWLFFEGNDSEGKEKIARELSSIVFGSPTYFVTIQLSTRFPPDDIGSKRSETNHSYMERFIAAIRDNPHRVIMMEDVELLDHDSQVRIKDAIERGRIQSFRGDEVTIGDAVIILSCKSFDTRQKKGSEEDECEEISSCVSLDLNLSCEDDDMELCCIAGTVGLLEAVDRTFLLKSA